MNSTKQILVILVCLLLRATAIAQEPQSARPSRDTSSREVTIIIQQRQLRFSAPASAQELKLEVLNQAGEMVYDSGLVTGAELSWALRNANGEAIPSGLYAYTLTIKEANSETAALRRGHLILESGRDRLWVTNQGAIGAETAMSGGEFTVSSGPETSVAGARIERSVASKGSGTINLQGFGTLGQIPQFGGGDYLVDSVISQDFHGWVGIGTTTPSSPLTVAGQIETKSGGIKFPNGTVQTTSAAGSLFQVSRNTTLTGNGTEGSPLGVNISALGLLGSVARNGTLVGDGTSAAPLGVAVPLALSGSSASSILRIINFGSGPAIYSSGNAGQNREYGGWVKALLFVNTNGTIARCYNGVTGAATGNCGFTISHPQPGVYDFNFGFQIDDRFITTTTLNNFAEGGCAGGSATVGPPNGNLVRIITFCDIISDKPFFIFVF
jgi:hypothetical protein